MRTLLRLLALIALAAYVPCISASEALDAQKILADSDAVRNPAQPFGLSIVLTEYRDTKEVDSNTLAIYSKLDGQSGRYRTLVSYLGPPRDAPPASGEPAALPDEE